MPFVPTQTPFAVSGLSPSTTPPVAFTPPASTPSTTPPVIFTPLNSTPSTTPPAVFTPPDSTPGSVPPALFFPRESDVASVFELTCLPTATITPNASEVCFVLTSFAWSVWTLTAGAHADDATHAAPLDFDAVTNSKHWLLTNSGGLGEENVLVDQDGNVLTDGSGNSLTYDSTPTGDTLVDGSGNVLTDSDGNSLSP